VGGGRGCRGAPPNGTDHHFDRWLERDHGHATETELADRARETGHAHPSGRKCQRGFDALDLHGDLRLEPSSRAILAKTPVHLRFVALEQEHHRASCEVSERERSTFR